MRSKIIFNEPKIINQMIDEIISILKDPKNVEYECDRKYYYGLISLVEDYDITDIDIVFVFKNTNRKNQYRLRIYLTKRDREFKEILNIKFQLKEIDRIIQILKEKKNDRAG